MSCICSLVHLKGAGISLSQIAGDRQQMYVSQTRHLCSTPALSLLLTLGQKGELAADPADEETCIPPEPLLVETTLQRDLQQVTLEEIDHIFLGDWFFWRIPVKIPC